MDRPFSGSRGNSPTDFYPLARYGSLRIVWLSIIAYLLIWPAASSAQAPRLSVQTGHSTGLTTIAFSSDSQFILTGDQGGTVILWNTLGQQIDRFDGSGVVKGVVLSTRFERIAIARESDAGTTSIEVRDLTGDAPPPVVKGARATALMPCFRFNDRTGALEKAQTCFTVQPAAYGPIELDSPDRRYHIKFDNGGGSAGGGEFFNVVYLTDSATGRTIELKRLSNVLTSLSFTNAARDQLLMQDIYGDSYLWSLAEGKEVNRFLIPDSADTGEMTDEPTEDDFTGRGATPVGAISADGRIVASMPYYSSSLFTWDTEAGSDFRELQLEEFSGPATAVGLTEDGKELMLQSCNGNTWIVNVATNAVVRKLKGFNSCGMAQARAQRYDAQFSSDGSFVLRGGISRPTAILNPRSGAVIKEFAKFTGFPVAISPNQKYLALDNSYSSKGSATAMTVLLAISSGRII
ncbi:MAG: hypothetical protein ABIP75_15215, partial [Pyrinomonadaceae bacterium]